MSFLSLFHPADVILLHAQYASATLWKTRSVSWVSLSRSRGLVTSAMPLLRCQVVSSPVIVTIQIFLSYYHSRCYTPQYLRYITKIVCTCTRTLCLLPPRQTVTYVVTKMLNRHVEYILSYQIIINSSRLLLRNVYNICHTKNCTVAIYNHHLQLLAKCQQMLANCQSQC